MAEGTWAISNIRIGFYGAEILPKTSFISNFKDKSNCEANRCVGPLIQLPRFILFAVGALWPRLTHGISRFCSYVVRTEIMMRSLPLYTQLHSIYYIFQKALSQK